MAGGFENDEPRTSVAGVHKGGNTREKRARERKLFTAGVARLKKPSSYRQSRVRRGTAPCRNDGRTEKMKNYREENIPLDISICSHSLPLRIFRTSYSLSIYPLSVLRSAIWEVIPLRSTFANEILSARLSEISSMLHFLESFYSTANVSLTGFSNVSEIGVLVILSSMLKTQRSCFNFR